MKTARALLTALVSLDFSLRFCLPCVPPSAHTVAKGDIGRKEDDCDCGKVPKVARTYFSVLGSCREMLALEQGRQWVHRPAPRLGKGGGGMQSEDEGGMGVPSSIPQKDSNQVHKDSQSLFNANYMASI